MLTIAALDGLVDDLLAECLPKAIKAGVQGATVEAWVKAEPQRALAALSAADPLQSLATWVAEKHEKDSFVQPWVIEGALGGELGCPLAAGGANEPWDTMGIGWIAAGATSALRR